MGKIEKNQRIALITGGSRGIGRVITMTLAKEGYKVAFTFKDKNSLANKVVEEITEMGGQAIAAQMIVEKRKSIKQCLDSIYKQYGTPISVLINNAAIAQEKSFETISDQDWEIMLKVNLQGPFMITQELLPGMISQVYGRIVNITSIGGQWGGFNQVHYAASKAGLINFTKSIAKIYSKYGITSNAVAIGLARTDMSGSEIDSEEGRKKVANIPIGRVATIEEVASVVKFISSEEASYITGQTINVNGGMYFG